MTRSYLKLDVLLPERKGWYTDGQFAAFVTLLCVAAEQPQPGFFRNERVLRVLMGRHARHIPFLVTQRDLIPKGAGVLYVHGWKEWQEGKFASIAERMAAIHAQRRPMTPAERAALYRHRKREARDAGVTDSVTPDVTVPVTLPSDRNSDRNSYKDSNSDPSRGATDLKIKEATRPRITPSDVEAGMALLPPTSMKGESRAH